MTAILKAEPVPFSSIVGQALLIIDTETGRAMAQLGIQVPAPDLDYRTIADAVTRAICGALPGSHEDGLDGARMLILKNLIDAGYFEGFEDAPNYCTINGCRGPIPKEIARAMLKEMRDEGLVLYGRGLFDDEGRVFGSGYCITPKGREWVAAREDEE